MFKRKKTSPHKDHKIYEKARYRSRLMGVSDMADWIDTTGSVMAQNVTQFRRNRDPKLISEIRDSAVAIVALADAMQERFDTIG